MYSSKLISLGSYLPKNVISNNDLANSGLDTNDEWIFSRTGIKERRVAESEECSSDMAVKAVQDALKSADECELNDIDLVILATTTGDYSFPSTACVTAGKLGLKNIPAFDLSAACSGFIYAMSVADSMIKTGKYKCACVIGVDKMSNLVDWGDRNTAILFGDGAGACILKSNSSSDKKGIIDYNIFSDGSFCDILKTKDSLVGEKNGCGVFMNGKEVFKHAVNHMYSSIDNLLQKNNLSTNNLDLFIPHQANDRIIKYLGEKMNLPEDKVISTVKKHANTSAASIPLAFKDAWSRGLIKDNALIGISAIGSGLTWGGMLIRI